MSITKYETNVKRDLFLKKSKASASKYKENVEFHIVGSSEVDSKAGKISNESPLGKALLGHKVDDIVYVEVNGNKSKYKILELSK